MAKFILKAAARVETGTKAMRKLRDGGQLPGNIYGHKKENRLVSFEAKEIRQFIQAGHRFLTVAVDGLEENGMLKEVQYASNGTDPIHIDIARVDVHEKISAAVRIETIGIAKGVTAGGNLDFPKREVNLEGPASAIPEMIPIKIESLDIGQAIRVKDLPQVPECHYLEEPEQVVIAVMKKLEEVPGPAVAAAAPSEPEVIGKKPSEEEVAEAGGKEAEGKKKEKE